MKKRPKGQGIEPVSRLGVLEVQEYWRSLHVDESMCPALSSEVNLTHISVYFCRLGIIR
jgi:hypothetical protein